MTMRRLGANAMGGDGHARAAIVEPPGCKGVWGPQVKSVSNQQLSTRLGRRAPVEGRVGPRRERGLAIRMGKYKQPAESCNREDYAEHVLETFHRSHQETGANIDAMRRRSLNLGR